MCSPKVRRLWIQKWTAESSSYWTILTSALHVTCSQLFTAVFSTGEFGSHQYFSQKIESLIVDHPELNIRATFSGHDHLFSAFQKGRQYFFVNGAGGGGIDQMTDSSYGVRKWPREELHGALPTVADNCYGYDLHLDSWMKFTRTEVNILKDKIVYDVRDLDSDVILQSYEQPI
ncbi:Calcineurin-like_phosphoesterase superfamily domain-containing protein [Hexamita inflata]|uniref:Calcineurin-like phosphoesterase superfamily domain-containing protein n=1 Tax=Hexamita inflata TaxID=28002 RepID=A0AA86V4A3_9EUKA|nr:Calcineurin-like phosphoesterase superfamily domain-containing protein [Hexamita inflata]